jgi:xanthine/uracil permease
MIIDRKTRRFRGSYFVYVLQHYLTMIGAIVSIPFILTPALCMREDDPARGHIISTMIFVTAIVTYAQVTFGCRYIPFMNNELMNSDFIRSSYIVTNNVAELSRFTAKDTVV